MLLNSKLPIDVLGRVWELADIDKDGMLDNDEFAVVRMNITPKTVQILPVTLLDRARFFSVKDCPSYRVIFCSNISCPQ